MAGRRGGLMAALGVAVGAILAGRGEAGAQAPPARAKVAWRVDQCLGGLTYGAPYKWALAYGMGLVRESDTSDWCVLAATKVGLGAVSANVGLANSLGRFGSGASLTAGVLRTFGHPLDAAARRTYVGGSVHLWPIVGLGGELGVYARVGTDPAGTTARRRLVVWSLGFGF